MFVKVTILDIDPETNAELEVPALYFFGTGGIIAILPAEKGTIITNGKAISTLIKESIDDLSISLNANFRAEQSRKVKEGITNA